jgi:hypothetical protein
MTALYFFVLGGNGLIERYNYKENQRMLVWRIQDLIKNNRSLLAELNSYQKKDIQPGDLLSWGFVRSGEIDTMIRQSDPAYSVNRTQSISKANHINTRRWRLGWFISMSLGLIIAVYVYQRNSHNGDE